MKILFGVFGTVLVFFLLYAYLAERERQQKMDVDDAWSRVESQQQAIKSDLDERLLQSETEGMRLKYGEATALKFEMCRKYPPTTDAHKRECARVEALKAKLDKWSKEHPW